MQKRDAQHTSVLDLQKGEVVKDAEARKAACPGRHEHEAVHAANVEQMADTTYMNCMRGNFEGALMFD
jgi:hypothetical protein